jgi:hypothetical protein
MTPEEIRQAEMMVRLYQGKGEAKVTITYDEWIRGTSLGPFSPRRIATQKLDEALKLYHATRGESFGQLKVAMAGWIDAHNASGKDWRKADRNLKSGMVEKLYNQIMLTDAALACAQMKDPKKWEEMKALRKEQQEAVATYFRGRSLVFKDQAWKSQLATVLNASAPVAAASTSVKKLATEGVSKEKLSNMAKEILGGQDPGAVFKHLGVSGLERAMHGLENFLSAAYAPAKIAYHIYKVGKHYSERATANRERIDFSPGNARAALDGVVRLIERDLRLAWVDIGYDTAGIVSSAFIPGVVASVAETVVDFFIHLKLYAIMGQEMEEGNRLLAWGHYNLDLFNASPLLGCCFLSMASVGAWLNFPVEYWGEPGFMDTMADIYEKADPILKKAREYIRLSKYALSGTEYLGWQPEWKSGQRLEFMGMLVNARPDQLGGFDLASKFRAANAAQLARPPLQRQNAMRNLAASESSVLPQQGTGNLGQQKVPTLQRQGAVLNLNQPKVPVLQRQGAVRNLTKH